jgi:hypothetical protein
VTYQLVRPPFSLRLWDKSFKDLRTYGAWYHEIKPERVAILTRAVRATLGFGDWQWTAALTLWSRSALGSSRAFRHIAGPLRKWRHSVSRWHRSPTFLIGI